MSGLGKPTGYGATVWDNVGFADVYYQTRPIPAIPEGRPIPGAYNTHLNDDPRVGAFAVLNPHSAIWQTVYIDSINNGDATTGYALSRVAGGTDLRPKEFNFFSTNQDHEHTPTAFKPENLAASEQEPFASTKQVPDWDLDSIIVNGAFIHPGDEFDALSIIAGDNLIPGWSHHRGGGSGRVREETGNYYLELDSSGISRTHNAFYLDPQAAVLGFDLRVNSGGIGEQLAVVVGDEAIATIDVDQATTSFVSRRVIIPGHLRGSTKTLTFKIVPASGSSVDAELHIDNVTLRPGGRTGDLLSVDLAALRPGDTEFSVIGWDIASPAPGSPLQLSIQKNALRGDHHLQVGGETIAYVLFSDRLEGAGGNPGNDFNDSGRLYVAPPAIGVPSAFDVDDASYGFQGDMRLWYRTGSRVAHASSVNSLSLISTLESGSSDAVKIAELNGKLAAEQTTGAKPQLATTAAIEEREIDLQAGGVIRQWLVSDLASDTHWVIADQNGTLSLFAASYANLAILPSEGTIDDQERVVSQAATPFEIAQMQQRLRYWNYPDENGDLLVVDGIVGSLTRHAAGLFTASVSNNEFETREDLSGVALNSVNSVNGPRWGELRAGEADYFALINGPFQPTSPARFHGTEWLIDTIRDGAEEAKTGANPIDMEIAVGAVSAANGPGPNSYHHLGHDAGMSVDFVVPATVPASGDGSLSAAEDELVALVAALQTTAYPGVTLREVRTSNSDVAAAINSGRLTPLAVVDSSIAGGLHVSINNYRQSR